MYKHQSPPQESRQAPEKEQDASEHLAPPPEAATSAAGNMRPDLADHFLQCSKLGRYLTVQDGSRFVITDDFRTAPVVSAASAIAAIYSKDLLVAQAALLPLSEVAQKLSVRERDKFERLFSLIEEEALADPIKNSARAIREAQFRGAEIRALEAELGDTLSLARARYREFLDVVKKLMDQKVTAGPFLDEYRAFTQDVAGRLDFGIYSFCLDRLMGSVRVPRKVKKLLVMEILNYPPVIRRELLTNILAFPGQDQQLIDFVKYMVQNDLGKTVAIEIELLEAFKLQRLTVRDIEGSLAAAAV